MDLHGKSLTEKPEGFIDKDEVPHAWHYLVNPGSSITGRCMLEGNDLTVLHNGEAAYPVMLKAISEAKERVFLSSFISVTTKWARASPPPCRWKIRAASCPATCTRIRFP